MIPSDGKLTEIRWRDSIAVCGQSVASDDRRWLLSQLDAMQARLAKLEAAGGESTMAEPITDKVGSGPQQGSARGGNVTTVAPASGTITDADIERDLDECGRGWGHGDMRLPHYAAALRDTRQRIALLERQRTVEDATSGAFEHFTVAERDALTAKLAAAEEKLRILDEAPLLNTAINKLAQERTEHADCERRLAAAERERDSLRQRLISIHVRFMTEFCDDLSDGVLYVTDFDIDLVKRLRLSLAEAQR